MATAMHRRVRDSVDRLAGEALSARAGPAELYAGWASVAAELRQYRRCEQQRAVPLLTARHPDAAAALEQLGARHAALAVAGERVSAGITALVVDGGPPVRERLGDALRRLRRLLDEHDQAREAVLRGLHPPLSPRDLAEVYRSDDLGVS